ncbi:single-stranded DNA-binding protein [Candidatus Jorgensenbacteria bacterium]|nr:single-stranded DNA-binding protein [Candidatus Jorgensenbacteria bacterium]
MNLNKVLLIGRLTADPQLRTTPGGQAVATLSMATNRVWTNKQGERQQDVQYHNVVVWGRQAEIVSQFLKKGSLAMIEGRLQTRTWQDKQGQTRKTTEIVSERIQLGPRSASNESGMSIPSSSGRAPSEGVDEVREELPEINLEEGDIKPEDVPF